MDALVADYDDVVDNIRGFNDSLPAFVEMRQRLSYFTAWYYSPELDLVAPSKFIGYKGMTAQQYLSAFQGISGTATEVVLKRWFQPAAVGRPSHRHVVELVSSLLGRYAKRPSRRARYNIPWRMRSDLSPSETTPTLELVWRAFQALGPDEQLALAERINESEGK